MPTCEADADEASAYACLISHAGGEDGRSESIKAVADTVVTTTAPTARMTSSCSRPAPKDYAFLFVGTCIGLFVGQYAFPSSSEPRADQMPSLSSGTTNSNPNANGEMPMPPLSDLIDGNNIRGDVSWMLDFSIVDFPKGGTTW